MNCECEFLITPDDYDDDYAGCKIVQHHICHKDVKMCIDAEIITIVIVYLYVFEFFVFVFVYIYCLYIFARILRNGYLTKHTNKSLRGLFSLKK